MSHGTKILKSHRNNKIYLPHHQVVREYKFIVSFESLEDLNKEDKINCDRGISSQNIARQRLNKHFILDYVISSE